MITNLVNGKIYIGKTKRLFSTRKADHKYHSKNPKHPIARAIYKYGWENFQFEIVESCKTEKELSAREAFWIESKNSCDPLVGYNIIKESQDHSKISSETTIQKITNASQGRKPHNSKHSIYLGAVKIKNKWCCQATLNKKVITKTCSSETEAAELYDKIVLYHYQNEATLNFPDKRSQYLQEDLQAIYENFLNRPKTSKQTGVCFDKTRNKWTASKTTRGKRIFFKRFDTEQEAVDFFQQQTQEEK
jgi:group I intron endonuclease